MLRATLRRLTSIGATSGFVGQRLWSPDRQYSNVVHHQDRSTEPLERSVTELLQFRFNSDIDGQPDDRTPQRADLLDDFSDTLFRQVAHDDRRPTLCESERGRAADTAARAGEHSDCAVEVERLYHAIPTAFVRRNSNSPSSPPSRP